LRWRHDLKRWDLQIQYHGLLFPAIALQMMLVIADTDNLYCCSGCGTPYIRARERKRPKRGWANYCEACCESGVAQRRAVETYRAKKAEARRTNSNPNAR
jgi:predicted SprT family Zn-dependent metalloprotease